MELIPFSGIQIVDFEIDLSDLEKPRKKFVVKNDVLFPLDDHSEKIPVEGQFTENYALVIEQFKEKWIPAPIFRFSGTAQDGMKQFDEGPSTWARMRAKIKKRNEKGEPATVVFQLAFDTTIDVENDDRLSGEDYYLMPSLADVLAEKEFDFVSEASQMDWFLDSQIQEDGSWIDTQTWVSDWIKDVMISNGVRETQSTLHRVWAKYFTFAEILGRLNVPTFKLLDTISDSRRYTPIETDFILDLGNSRTCGILLEKPDNQDIKIESAIPFKIRDFENAEVYRSGLMESRVELSQPNFGRDDLAKKTGRMDAFLWPSPVRIGSEARSLQLKSKGTDTASGLSSAKRYLWDQNPVEREWRFQGSNPSSQPMIAIQTKQLLTESGDLRQKGDPAARETRFSRSSFMMFMIAELIAHAFTQINNPQERGLRPNSSIPRRLSRIILTIPTATPSREQSILKKRAHEALEYVWKLLQLPEDKTVYAKPELLIEWDEASCSQQVFLFNEISQNYNHKSCKYLSDFGRKRSINRQNYDSLRIASIDIGGGTTDLMITTYYDPNERDVIHPIQEFREGFRTAGDDILYGIIRDALIPGFIKHLEKFGAKNASMACANFFQSVDDALSGNKSNFANSILVPTAISILSQFELADTSVGVTQISDPSEYNQYVFKKILDDLAISAGITAWPKSSVELEVSYSQFKAIVDNVLSRVINNITLAIANFDCDYVLLTGRPSKLPYVRSLFENMMIVPPDRLVSLHEYSVGVWYPFRDAMTGKIGDPKSTVVVGALLNSVAGFELDNFSFKSERLKLRSTSNFIGELESTGQLKDEKIIVDNVNKKNDEEFTYEFTNPVHFGSRQISDENWSTSPLYRLSVPSAGLGKFSLPLTVTLRRDPDAFENYDDKTSLENETKKEELVIAEISDQEGRFAPSNTLTLSFNTLGKVDNYWLETGLFT
jgi:hypothetical protein